MIRLEKARGLFDFCRNMGWRYTAFRFWYEIQMRTGLLRFHFPVQVTKQTFISVTDWRNLPVKFFFEPGNIQVKKNRSLRELEINVQKIAAHKFLFFSHKWYDVADWHTNPETGFVYDKHVHWTAIPDFSKEAGDIKFVWEKSRFTFLYDLIRYDYHFEKSQEQLVFGLIEDWINANPVNCGPNWRCSQEITLRVLNWLFALHYYQDSREITQNKFDKIIGSIRHQMQHVSQNLKFSLIAVRNNHALTESLGLYLVGLLLPFFPESKDWKTLGKACFEKEVSYQIYPDGTFLQFSMNYHRVVVQLLCWAIGLAHANGEIWSDIVYNRAEKSFRFLRTCQDDFSGQLPNYGNNDGALFFPLTSCDFRDFRPQLATLAGMLGMNADYGQGNWDEEANWLLPPKDKGIEKSKLEVIPVTASFADGGYHILRDEDTITFLRCGRYKDRPFQADNLHLDIWVGGENILRDAGSYHYNIEEKWTAYFNGTASHNTIMVGDFDQMKGVSRFIWSDWIKIASGKAWEKADQLVIEAEFEGYRHLGKGITHRRKVMKKKGQLLWIVEDWVTNVPGVLPIHQIWHPYKYFFENYNLNSWDEFGNEITATEMAGWYSDYYGKKVRCPQIVFSSRSGIIKTEISLKIMNKVWQLPI